MTSEQELDDFRRHEREILAKMGIGTDLAKRPVTMREFTVAMADTITAIRTLSARLEAMEQADAYKGVFQRALPYRRGSQVTHAGALWVALDDVPKGIVPGFNPDLWQLASKGAKPVKAGKANR
jgi:hypothetical protein